MKVAHHRKSDDFSSCKSVFMYLRDYIEPGSTVLDPFWNDGSCKEYIEEVLGVTCIHEEGVDAFERPKPDPNTIILSNIPFSIKEDVLDMLYNWGNPFVIIMPLEVLTRKFFRKYPGIQVIIPAGFLEFKPKLNVYCAFFCYKMSLPSDMILAPTKGEVESRYYDAM